MATLRAEWAERDFYADLGISPAASAQEITSAYRSLARMLHPDARDGDPAGEQRFGDVSLAYEVLSREDTRRSYDELRAGAGQNPPTTTSTTRAGRRSGNDGDPKPTWVAAGAEEIGTLRLSLGQAVYGATVELPGLLPSAEPVRVRVPPGVRDGQTVRLPARSTVGPPDRRLVIRVSAHPYYARRGDDLLLTLPVTYPEAVLGADVDVPTLDGEVIVIRVPPATPSGRTFRLKGLGMPLGNGERGDLVVTFEIAVSREPTGRERRALNALVRAMPSPRTALMESTQPRRGTGKDGRDRSGGPDVRHSTVDGHY